MMPEDDEINSFSRVAFNENKTEALFIWYWYLSPTGASYDMIYMKKDKKWFIVFSIFLWIS